MKTIQWTFVAGLVGVWVGLGCGQTQTRNNNLTGTTTQGGSQTKADAGTSVISDAGTTATDAGSSQATDAGVPVPVDAGTTTADAGTSGACRDVSSFKAVSTNASYDDAYGVAFTELRDSATEPYNMVFFEQYDLSSFPQLAQFDSSTLYQTCPTCVIYAENCTDTKCDKFYFAQGGSADVTDVTYGATGGSITATAKDLTLVEWDFDSDTPVSGGSCVTMSSVDFSSSW